MNKIVTTKEFNKYYNTIMGNIMEKYTAFDILLMEKYNLLFILIAGLCIVVFKMKIYTRLNMVSLCTFIIALRLFFIIKRFLSYNLDNFTANLLGIILPFTLIGSIVCSIISIHIKINLMGIIMLIVSGLFLVFFIGIVIFSFLLGSGGGLR